MVHDTGWDGGVVSHGIFLHFLEGCMVNNEIHGFLRERLPQKLEDLLDFLFGVLEWEEDLCLSVRWYRVTLTKEFSELVP